VRAVLGYTGAHVVETACRNTPVRRDMLDTSGEITDPAVRAEVADTLVELIRAVDAAAGDSPG
jgi:hypothetical protein